MITMDWKDLVPQPDPALADAVLDLVYAWRNERRAAVHDGNYGARYGGDFHGEEAELPSEPMPEEDDDGRSWIVTLKMTFVSDSLDKLPRFADSLQSAIEALESV